MCKIKKKSRGNFNIKNVNKIDLEAVYELPNH